MTDIAIRNENFPELPALPERMLPVLAQTLNYIGIAKEVLASEGDTQYDRDLSR